MNRSRLFAKLARHCFSLGTEIGTDRAAGRKRELVTVFCSCTILVISVAAAAAHAGPAQFQTILDRLRIEQDVPGVSAVVIRDKKVLYAGGSGVADIETGRPADANTVYYIGSVTKVLTSILTLHLVEQDKIDLDAPLASIVDDLGPAFPHISIFDLLTHTSGLEREGQFGYWYTARFPDRDALTDYLSSTSLRSDPGAELHYSNIGFAALGLVAESVTGQPYAEALRSIVLQPLGISATGAPGPAPKVANGYTPPGRIIPSEEHPFAGVGRSIAGRHERMYHDAGAMSPAFGAYSSVQDMSRLALFLLGNGGDDILSRSARQRMHERQPLGRGLGIGLTRKNARLIMSHGGWFAAHRSQLLVDPEKGVAVVVLANSDSADPGHIADALYDAAWSLESP